MLSDIYHFLHRISRFGVWICGGGFLLISIGVFIEVLMRYLFQTKFSGSGELAGYIFAISTTWGFSYCLFEKTHVRIDFAYQHMPKPLKGLMDWLSLLSLLVFSVLLASKAWMTFMESIEFSSMSTSALQTPLWIPQLAWAVGFIMFALNAAFLVVYTGLLLLAGDRQAAAKVASIPSTHE